MIGYTNPITGQGFTGAKTPAETMATLRPDTVLGDHSNPTPPPSGPQGPQGGNQGAFPDVQGGQYQSPGAAGVTKYGLFSNAGRAPRTPGAFPRGPTLPPGFVGRGGQGWSPPAPRGAAIPRIPTPAMMPRVTPRFGTGTGTGQMMTGQMGGSSGGGQGALGQQPRPVNNDPRALLNALRGGMGGRQQMRGGNPLQPQAMQQPAQQPPPNQQNAGLQQQFNQQQQQAAAQQAARGQNALTSYTPFGDVTIDQNGIRYGDAPGNTGDVDQDTSIDVGGAAGDIAAGFGSAAGTAMGEGFSSFVDAWNAANPGSNMSYEDFLNIPGFDPSSLTGDVGQNWTSAMDPAAWEQMAQNRLSAANEANMGALNRGERRLADRAGRTGFANTGGVTSQMYQDYAGRGLQAERDIYNDTLMNQMNALQGASQYALGQSAQDQARWLAEYGGALHGADLNFGANREDNPSGAAVLGDLLGAAGGVAGGAMEGAGGLMSVLGPLFAMLGGV